MGGRPTPKILGSLGEAFALAFLQGQGLTLIGRNWRDKTGEIDLIMQDQNQLVFVEVKTRWFGSLVSALELVTPLKLDKLKHLSLAWLNQNGWRKYRIDAIGVVCNPRVQCQWVKEL